MISTTSKPKISRVRWRVLAMLFVISMVTYLDRVVISTTAPAMMKDLGLSPLQMGWVFSIFIFGYGIFEIPGGWMGDRWGARGVLTRIVLWWSFFTAATAWAWSYSSLLVIRFLFGAGEAGAFPNCASVVSRWFPSTERARAKGTLLTGTRIGGAIAPGFVVILMAWLGWRRVFEACALLGAVWAVAWFRWFRNTPEEHSSVGAEELAEIRERSLGGDVAKAPRSTPVQWSVLLRSKNLWAICAMYSGYSFGLYFYLTWLPTYLLNARGVKLSTLGFWAGLPLLVGACSNVLGGFASDWITRRKGLRWGRRLPAGLGLFASAALLLVSLSLQSPFAALIAMVASFACADVILGPAWATCLDIGKEQAGTVTGCMNSFGQIGGMISPALVGWIVGRWGTWNVPLLLTAAAYLFSACMWLVIDPEKPLGFRDARVEAIKVGGEVSN